MAAYNPAEGNNSYTEAQLEEEFHKAGRREFSQDRKEEIKQIKNQFLELLAKGATVGKALSVVNGTEAHFGSKTTRLGRKTAYSWRQYDEEFRADWDEAVAIGNDLLEQRITDYAMEEDPRMIDKVLRWRNPQRYGLNRTEVSGPGGSAINVDLIEIVAATADDADPAPEE